MIRISLGAFAALAIVAMVGALALLAQPGVVEAQSPSASRTLPAELGRARRRTSGHHHRQQLRRLRAGGGDAAGRLHLRQLGASQHPD